VTDSTESPDLQRRSGLRRLKEGTYGGLFAACAAITLLTTVAIFVTLLSDAVVFFQEIPITEFLTGTNWSPNPAGGGQAFGIIPLLIGTLVVTITAAFIALPLGTLTAIYLSEYATSNARSILKPLLEILAGIPTVVYGYFALVYITPALKATLFPSMSTFNALSASIMVGIMTIPMVSSISEDAMSAVPDDLRQAGYGLGATKFEVSTGIVVPASISGISSSYILAVSRAIGETMIVVMAGGLQTNLFDPLDPFGSLAGSGRTMTAAMVNAVTSDATGGSPEYYSMFAIGLSLFAITFLMNLASNRIAARYREVYQ
jgi:phosphate ABC transporter, permease protein PstC